MKKLYAIVGLIGLCLSLHAQGLVSIHELAYTISTNEAEIGGGSGPLGFATNAYYFDVLTLTDPTGATNVPVVSSMSDLVTGGWFDEQVYGTNGTGILRGKIVGAPANLGVAANNWPAGTTNFFVVVGWSANEGTSWSQVSTEIENGTFPFLGLHSAMGWSAVGYGASTNQAPPFPVFGFNPGQLGAFTLYAIPEPGSLALASVGILCLYWFGRKNTGSV